MTATGQETLSSRHGMPEHAHGHDGQGRTLCGLAVEGECREGGDPAPLFATSGGIIACPDCRAIIQYVYRAFTPYGRVRP